jgi:hypothetical protein
MLAMPATLWTMPERTLGLTPEACGDTTCGADEHCCALCPGEDDVCVPNWYVGCPVADDFDCQPHDCAPDTDPSGAAVGDCDAILGYWWNGTDCRSLSGCSCSGAACAGLFATEEACRAAHSGCFLRDHRGHSVRRG